MELLFYEDQTGFMVFPEKRSDKDNQIVSFFNNSVDLYIEKIGNNLRIYCHLIAYKSSTRPLGYYIIYKDSYNENIFTNLKSEAQKILNNLELQLRSGHADNIIFENIEKFDNKYQQYRDTDLILESINYGKNLDFSAGNISEISALCKDILKRAKNIKISLSSKKSDLGNINILINKKYAESLKRDESTEYILNDTRERLKQKDKREKGEPGLAKIREGFTNVRQGIETLRNIGYTLPEIQESLDQTTIGEIFGCNIKGLNNRISSDKGKSRKESRKDVKGIDTTEEKTGGGIFEFIIKVGAVIAILMVITILFANVMPEEYKNIKGKIIGLLPDKEDKSSGPNIEIPSMTPNVVSTPKATPIPTPTKEALPLEPIEPLFNISGFVMNRDNVGMSNWTINLYDINGTGLDKTTTGENGFYVFKDQKNGSYNVTEIMEEGWKNMSPTYFNIDIQGKDKTGVNFINSNITK